MSSIYSFAGTAVLKRFSLVDRLFALAAAFATCIALARHIAEMDVYEVVILVLAGTTLGTAGMRWRSLQTLSYLTVAVSALAVTLYGGDLMRGGQLFLLKYFLSSQTAVLWMGLCVWCSTAFYVVGTMSDSVAWQKQASRLAWTACLFGMVGLLVRWHESYLLGSDIGHIPVSNLYEVFVLFSIITTLLYLRLEDRLDNRALGAFVMPAVSAAVGFLFWYGAAKGAHDIQPLIPALKSYWMKIHVPTNFVGYGAFSIAAMLGVAWLAAGHHVSARRLPSREWIGELMYKCVALGFVFFTIATILGALWAAEAWGGYWSWDPKETWALIVWLNYAAWLHCRLVKNLRGPVLAWWAIVGFFVTLFAFLGVNIFLSGLHSYGSL